MADQARTSKCGVGCEPDIRLSRAGYECCGRLLCPLNGTGAQPRSDRRHASQHAATHPRGHSRPSGGRSTVSGTWAWNCIVEGCRSPIPQSGQRSLGPADRCSRHLAGCGGLLSPPWICSVAGGDADLCARSGKVCRRIELIDTQRPAGDPMRPAAGLSTVPLSSCSRSQPAGSWRGLRRSRLRRRALPCRRRRS